MSLNSSDTPTIKRRLTTMIYEGVLLFGVIAIAGLLFSIIFQQRNALYLRHALQYWLFFVVGAYFIWFWIHSGQTLPMKTWRIRLVTVDNHTLSFKHAVARYFLAWLWFLPGLAIAWALAAYVHPSRQFLHDRIAGTKLIQLSKIK
jgi:uncharacterized RDD family membrane protein YckC